MTMEFNIKLRIYLNKSKGLWEADIKVNSDYKNKLRSKITITNLLTVIFFISYTIFIISMNGIIVIYIIHTFDLISFNFY